MCSEADLPRGRRAFRPATPVPCAPGISALLVVLGLAVVPAPARAALPGDDARTVAPPARTASPPGQSPRATDAPAGPPARGTIAAGAAPDGPELAVALARPAPAAVFRYGGHVWIVVATAETLKPASAGAGATRLFPGLEITRLDGAVALRLPYRAGRRVTARREGATWRFTYVEAEVEAGPPVARRSVARPPASLDPVFREATLDAVVVSVADARLSTVHRMVDPVVGTTLIVTTSAEPGAAVRFAYRATPFRLLPTRLGVAVEVRADGVEVERVETGIRIRYRRPSAPSSRR